jgi:hypothetical protein
MLNFNGLYKKEKNNFNQQKFNNFNLLHQKIKEGMNYQIKLLSKEATILCIKINNKDGDKHCIRLLIM